jgi:hypothetical protein
LNAAGAVPATGQRTLRGGTISPERRVLEGSASCWISEGERSLFHTIASVILPSIGVDDPLYLSPTVNLVGVPDMDGIDELVPVLLLPVTGNQ